MMYWASHADITLRLVITKQIVNTLAYFLIVSSMSFKGRHFLEMECAKEKASSRCQIHCNSNFILFIDVSLNANHVYLLIPQNNNNSHRKICACHLKRVIDI